MKYLEKRSHLARSLSSTKYDKVAEDRITPEHLYISRRKFIVAMGIFATTAALAACTNQIPGTSSSPPSVDDKDAGSSNEPDDKLTSYEDITNYNNFYEFSYDKEDVARLSRDFKTSDWVVTVGGLVNNPRGFGVTELIEKYQPEERIYRMRCVEAWSMVIPWFGFPLSRLLNDVEPKPEAKFVRFKSFYDPTQMPGDRSLPFPYFEGLRLDEAMHDLTILASGIYDKPLPSQDGAPIRLVVPWKYGFKSAKSIVSIELTAEMPSTFWSTLAPNEYGFYANVNPNVSHPRWSQASERRIGELQRRTTLMFNGYDQISPLYQGMDLSKFY
jgi:sulfoxide reductase catalytic subunit YedY